MALSMVAMSVMTGCSDDPDSTKKIDFTLLGDVYNEQGYWNKCYDTDVNNVNVAGFSFSHSASVSVWDGVTYYSWNGFCPSISSDKKDHSSDNWTEYQWSAVTGRGVKSGAPYMVAMWDVAEDASSVPGNPSCCIRRVDGKSFRISSLSVTNSSYGYYVMKQGSAFSKPFGKSDWFTLHIHGVSDGSVSATIDVDLASDGNILDTWKSVDLSALGDVDMIYFTMTSSDTGQWGMNNPAYFCLDGIEVFRQDYE